MPPAPETSIYTRRKSETGVARKRGTTKQTITVNFGGVQASVSMPLSLNCETTPLGEPGICAVKPSYRHAKWIKGAKCLRMAVKPSFSERRKCRCTRHCATAHRGSPARQLQSPLLSPDRCLLGVRVLRRSTALRMPKLGVLSTRGRCRGMTRRARQEQVSITGVSCSV